MTKTEMLDGTIRKLIELVELVDKNNALKDSLAEMTALAEHSRVFWNDEEREAYDRALQLLQPTNQTKL
jgi:hypothetical protein